MPSDYQEALVKLIGKAILEDMFSVDLTKVISPQGKVINPKAITVKMSSPEISLWGLILEQKKLITNLHKQYEKTDFINKQKMLYLKKKRVEEKRDELTKLLLTLIRIRLGEKQIALRENFQIEIIPEKPSENIVVNSYEEF
ncbi:MAG: hypothetical protein KAS02_03115 [Candidatus Pacebacteria bacterium]|nr:hypothetical protein [Candidatus Paceibacterota bacterium]